jgi:hypothetical protein
MEPTVIYATVRDAVEDLHIECRMSDGQKGAFITVDVEFPELAHRVAAMLSPTPEQRTATQSLAQRDKARNDALEEAAKVCDSEATCEGVAQKCAVAIRAMKECGK